MRYRLRTLAMMTMLGSAFIAAAVCPLADFTVVARLTGLDSYDLSQLSAAGFLLFSIASAVISLGAVFASEELPPARFWGLFVAFGAASFILWALALPFIQAARE
jgi:hypothetical protein